MECDIFELLSIVKTDFRTSQSLYIYRLKGLMTHHFHCRSKGYTLAATDHYVLDSDPSRLPEISNHVALMKQDFISVAS